MKIVHCESGLGNQMFNYAEYLAIKQANPDDKCYFENIVYEIPETTSRISFWNGYELEKVFGIKIPNIRELFSEKEWQEIVDEVKRTEFWNDNWNYAKAITTSLNKRGFNLENRCKSLLLLPHKLSPIQYFMNKTSLGAGMKSYVINHFHTEQYKNRRSRPEDVFIKSENNIYCGQTLLFMYNGNNIELIENDLRKSFVFPKLDGDQNVKLLEKILNTESVGVHVRRGDSMNFANAKTYEIGYFPRAIHYIKRNVSNPVFFIFSDPDTCNWCKQNIDKLGLSRKDAIEFVDWNKAEDNYKDLDLLSKCKHTVFSNSSFGWWASYLNSNPNKITCSPMIEINTTHHF